ASTCELEQPQATKRAYQRLCRSRRDQTAAEEGTMTLRGTARLGVLAALLSIPGAAFATLFGTIPNGNDTTLVTVDPSTGGATVVGPIGFADVQGLATRVTDGRLFAATSNAGSPNAGQVLTIDITVASLGTQLQTTDGRPMGDLAWSPTTSVLYATCNRFSLS